MKRGLHRPRDLWHYDGNAHLGNIGFVVAFLCMEVLDGHQTP